MTDRIFKAIFSVALIVLFCAILLIMGVLYEYFAAVSLTQLGDDARILQSGVEELGISYLDTLGELNSRVTLIASDGTVLWDSYRPAESMDNHSDREEFMQAVESGEGQSVRYSATYADRTVYCAVRLADGSVLRTAHTQQSMLSLALGMMQPFTIVLASAIGASALLASRLSKSIVRPINELDINAPGSAVLYPELKPLTERLSAQNEQINRQIEELQRRQRELTTITENMSEGLILIDGAGRVLLSNKSAEKIFSPTGGSIFSYDSSNEFSEALGAAMSGANATAMLHRNERTYQLFANPVLGTGESLHNACVLLVLDVTESADAERLRREFTANVSHELKTPLTSISGFAELMAGGMARAEDTKHFSELIYSEAQRLIALINDIIRLSKLDEQNISEPKEPIALRELLSEEASRLALQAEAKNITIKISGEESHILGNRAILDEMFYNIMENAVKYNHVGGRLDIELSHSGKGELIIFRDTGIGIAASDLPRVFERFYRADKSRSGDIGGTGLGLSIVKHAARYHGAAVNIESEENVGTLISVLFPPMSDLT